MIEALRGIISIGGREVGRKNFFFKPKYPIEINTKAKTITFHVEQCDAGHLVETAFLLLAASKEKSDSIRNATTYLNLAIQYIWLAKAKEKNGAAADIVP